MNIHDMENLLLSEMETVTGGVTGGTCTCTSAALQVSPPKCNCSSGAIVAGTIQPPGCVGGSGSNIGDTCVCTSGAVITT